MFVSVSLWRARLHTGQQVTGHVTAETSPGLSTFLNVLSLNGIVDLLPPGAAALLVQMDLRECRYGVGVSTLVAASNG